MANIDPIITNPADSPKTLWAIILIIIIVLAIIGLLTYAINGTNTANTGSNAGLLTGTSTASAVGGA